MLTDKSKENLKFFRTFVVGQIDNPREWIRNQVAIARPDFDHPEVIDQLMRNLNAFLSIEEVYDNLDRGGTYSCEVVFKGKTSQWYFEFTEDNPYCAFLGLYSKFKEGDGQWSPPQT